MKYEIHGSIEIEVGDYWRDSMGNRWMITSVNPQEIIAMSEIDSLERLFRPESFYRRFRFEA